LFVGLHFIAMEMKISSTIADIEGDRMNVRSFSILTADNLSAPFSLTRCLNTLGMSIGLCY